MAPFDFDSLRELQNSANDQLLQIHHSSPPIFSTQEKWVNEISESSLRMLDMCGISKDVLSLVKQHLQDLHSTLRRAAIFEDPSGIKDKIIACNDYRKKLKEETSKCLKCFKRMKSKKSVTSNNNNGMKQQDLMLVVDVLRQVRVTSTCIVESLLSLISTPWLNNNPKRKTSYFGSISKLIIEDDDECDMMVLQSANKRLEGVRLAIEHLETEFDCIYRRLIHTRVLLLNVLTN